MKAYALKSLNIFLLVGICLTLLAMAGTPLVLTASLKHYTEFMNENPHAVLLLTLSFYICAIPFLLAMLRLKRICTYFGRGDFFAPEVSLGFKRIAHFAFADAVIIFSVQFLPSVFFGSFLYALSVIPALLFPFICITIGLLSLVLAIVFREATEIKEENESIF